MTDTNSAGTIPGFEDYTDTEPTPYTGPLQPGVRFRLRSGRLGEVSGVRQDSLYIPTGKNERGDTAYRHLYRKSYRVVFFSVNQKTGRAWQGVKSTDVARAEASIVAPE